MTRADPQPPPARPRGYHALRNAVALRLLAVLRALLRGPSTVEGLAADAGIGRRMVYRYIRALETAGVPVVRSPEDRVLYRVHGRDLLDALRAARPTPPARTRRRRRSQETAP